MDIKNWLDIVTSIISIVSLFFFIYLYFRNPDIKVDKVVSMNSVSCGEKHKRLDEIILEMRENFKSIQNSILLIKENDIKHIENEMRRMSEVQIKILTIIEYNDKK